MTTIFAACIESHERISLHGGLQLCWLVERLIIEVPEVVIIVIRKYVICWEG